MKKILCLLLCIFIITATVAPMTAYADPSGDTPSESQTDPEPQPEPEPEPEPEPQPPVVKTESQVTVGKTKINKQLSEAVKIEVTVTPATPARTVLLQRYNKDEDTYITQKTFTTSNSKTAKLQISIPKEMRKKTESFWRIYVPETDTAKSAVSKTVTVYTSNLKHIKLSSKACCIYCLDTKKVIYQKRMNKRLKPASCTKIMTLITAIETGKIHGKSSVTSSAVHVPAQRLHARVGDRYRNMDMAYAMILGSANDASIILAKGTAGSVSNFVRRMNKTAKKIGLKDSHFTNTYGVPNRTHYTTAYELSLMSAYGYKYDTYCKVVGRKMYGFRSLKYGKKYGCFTADRMVKNKVKGHIGGKTGFSEVLGASYSGLFKYKGRVYAVTIMHAKTKGIRWKDVRKLYKYVRKYGKSTY